MFETHHLSAQWSPFSFIPEIADIKDLLKKMESENDAILLRKKILELKNHPHYMALNQKKLDAITEQTLLFLAEKYPINHKDPITLEEFETGEFISLTSGHRFKVKALYDYIIFQNFKDIKNPLTNQKLTPKETIRILKNVEQKHPELFLSSSNNIKEIYYWKQTLLEAFAYFENCSEDEIHRYIENYYQLSLITFPIINLLSAEIILLHYYLWFLPIPIPKMSILDERFIILSNLLALIISQTIYECVMVKDKAVPLPFQYYLNQNLINCASVLGLDLLAQVCKNLHEQSDFILTFRSYLLSYGAFFIALHNIFPKHHFDMYKYIQFAYAQLSFMLISNVLLKSCTYMLYPDNYEQQINTIMQANLLCYLPHCLFFYFLLSELKKISHILNDENEADTLQDIIQNPML